LANKRVVYDLLFRAAAATLLQVAANPKRLGAAIGGLMVLHTWGQRLQHHPHVHCVVPAGGLSPEGTRWIHARPTFFLPVKVSAVFRGKLMPAAWASRRPAAGAPTRSPEPAFARGCDHSITSRGCLAKPPFGSPAHVLHYLARYTHRVAISNHRLVAVTDDTVSFRWKDYRHGSQIRTLTLDVDEFLRRFLLHVLPKRFVRIRYSASSPAPSDSRTAQCRQALAAAQTLPNEPRAPARRAVAVPSLRRAHAHRRAADRAAALSRSAPGRLP
jgi:hypothetical protein